MLQAKAWRLRHGAICRRLMSWRSFNHSASAAAAHTYEGLSQLHRPWNLCPTMYSADCYCTSGSVKPMQFPVMWEFIDSGVPLCRKFRAEILAASPVLLMLSSSRKGYTNIPSSWKLLHCVLFSSTGISLPHSSKEREMEMETFNSDHKVMHELSTTATFSNSSLFSPAKGLILSFAFKSLNV